MKNGAATSVVLGFDFQASAAIVLMLENIQKMDTIRLEGEEDIDITLNGGQRIFAQAKSVEDTCDDSNALKKLKDTLESLARAEKRCSSIKELIYITNSPNPLTDSKTMHLFREERFKKYNDLPSNLQNKITKYIPKSETLSLDKLKIQVLPFNPNPSNYPECVLVEIGDFIAKISCADYVSRNQLYHTWWFDTFKSGTRKNQAIQVTKKDIIWPVIVFVTDNLDLSNEDFDDATVNEIRHRYKTVINTFSEQFEFVTSVLSAYNEFQSPTTQREKRKHFIEGKYQEYLYLCEGIENMNDKIKQLLVQIILRNILQKYYQIESIKKTVAL